MWNNIRRFRTYKKVFRKINLAGLGKGFGQAIGFTVLAALVLYLLSTWVDLPVIGAFIAKLINIVDQYREGR